MHALVDDGAHVQLHAPGLLHERPTRRRPLGDEGLPRRAALALEEPARLVDVWVEVAAQRRGLARLEDLLGFVLQRRTRPRADRGLVFHLRLCFWCRGVAGLHRRRLGALSECPEAQLRAARGARHGVERLEQVFHGKEAAAEAVLARVEHVEDVARAAAHEVLAAVVFAALFLGAREACVGLEVGAHDVHGAHLPLANLALPRALLLLQAIHAILLRLELAPSLERSVHLLAVGLALCQCGGVLLGLRRRAAGVASLLCQLLCPLPLQLLLFQAELRARLAAPEVRQVLVADAGADVGPEVLRIPPAAERHVLPHPALTHPALVYLARCLAPHDGGLLLFGQARVPKAFSALLDAQLRLFDAFKPPLLLLLLGGLLRRLHLHHGAVLERL
mmetsp:Transcript_18578/g.56732  ORF Transcript_18578/g.56732 Transcript_18578/m.56732 type:complete len:391 (-) Transcript_18578:927-2099(-)